MFSIDTENTVSVFVQTLMTATSLNRSMRLSHIPKNVGLSRLSNLRSNYASPHCSGERQTEPHAATV
jgi:hypothetical protein